MEKTKLLVLPRYILEAFKGESGFEETVIISITDPKSRRILIPGKPKDVLELKFWDVNDDNGILDEDAEKISRFAKKYWGTAKTIIVQCEAGISRSAGVAAAISKWYNNDDTMYFNSRDYRPNVRCYRKVLNALSKDVGRNFTI